MSVYENVDAIIFQAIEENDAKKLQEYAGYIESGGCTWSPLHKAAQLGRTELLRFILAQRFVHVNDDFEDGDPDDFRTGTALTEALINEHVDTALFLIEHGASVNAAYHGYENTHCMGLEIEESGNCLTLALEIGDEELIQAMQKHRLDVNRTFYYEHRDITPFAYYLECGGLEALQKVFDLGADISGLVKDEWNIDVTPLMRSIQLYLEKKSDTARKRRLAVIDWLLRHGADLSYVHKELELPTALSLVTTSNDAELNRLFGWSPVIDNAMDDKELGFEYYRRCTAILSSHIKNIIRQKLTVNLVKKMQAQPAFGVLGSGLETYWEEVGVIANQGSDNLLYETLISQLDGDVLTALKALPEAEQFALWACTDIGADWLNGFEDGDYPDDVVGFKKDLTDVIEDIRSELLGRAMNSLSSQAREYLGY